MKYKVLSNVVSSVVPNTIVTGVSVSGDGNWIQVLTSSGVIAWMPAENLQAQDVPGVTFDPLDGTYAPELGVYVVAPLSEQTLEKLSDYTVKKKPTNFYPATLFGKVRQAGKVALNTSYVPANIMNLLVNKINTSQGSKYLNTKTDGVIFSAGFRVTVFPGQTVNIIDSTFIKVPRYPAQWFVELQTMSATVDYMGTVDPSTLPPYLLQHQSDINYNGVVIDGKTLMGFDAILPLAAVPGQSIWIQALALLNVQAQQ